MSRYEDPILKKIVDLMEKEGPNELKGRWGRGDPIVVSAGALPRAFVSFDNQTFKNDTDQTHASDNSLVISVVVDMKREFAANIDRIESHEQVAEFCAAREKDGKISRNSIVGVLLANQDLLGENMVLNIAENDIEVNYGVGIEKRGPGIMTAEATISFTLEKHQINPEFY